MTEQPVYNPGPHIRYIGQVAIPPGETRMVDARFVPAEVETPELEMVFDALDDLLKLSVRDLSPRLPLLIDEDLDEIERRENAKPTPRKSLLDAITMERLNRAQQTADQDDHG